MNTKNLKAYAPKARSQFIEAIKKRAAQFGLYQDEIVEMQSEGSSFIIEGRAFSQKQGQQRQQLERKINGRSEVTHTERYNLFIREMAYTWFNRLVAIRYMELHDYLDHGFRVLSNPNNPESLPEILDHASDVVDSLDPLSSSGQGYLDKNHIVELQLAGNKEEELYRELLLGQCHRLYNIMPFMFEAIDDATELLLPGNLTKTDSILKGLVNEIPEEDWSEIEVIGWLYQAYISEHKDAVIGTMVKSEDIPAATQLFTPNWIVKYLVQNSLGRQWLATYPESELKSKMEYYIEPAEQFEGVIEQLKGITPGSIDPEQIKCLDPAVGSGHILVEIYDVLREVYLERGYRLREIPELILTKNIYGLDIDDRAAQLAGFALMMKAREDDRRIFERVERGDVQLNIYSLQSTEKLDVSRLWQALDFEGNQKQGSTAGLFDISEELSQPTGIYKEYFELLQTLKSSFLQAKTFGSLIRIEHQHLQNLEAILELLQAKEKGSDPSSKQAANDLLPVINQAILLARQYDVVLANPPYMGSGGMNPELKVFAKRNYPDSKSDFFTMFFERGIEQTKKTGSLGFLAPFVWMFLSSYKNLREHLLNQTSVTSLVQLEYNAFEPACIPVAAFTLNRENLKNFKGSFIKLSQFKGHLNQPLKLLEAINSHNCDWLFEINVDDVKNIPGSPLAYWINPNLLSLFKERDSIGNKVKAMVGLQTSDNDRFLRYWYEVDYKNIEFQAKDHIEAHDSPCKWFPHNKGGGFRKWWGNQDYVVNFKNSGEELKSFKKSVVGNPKHFFSSCVAWSDLTSGTNAFRLYPDGFTFDNCGPAVFDNECVSKEELLCLLNNSNVNKITQILNPTLHFRIGYFNAIPYATIDKESSIRIANAATFIAKNDWDAYERSWEFSCSPLTKYKYNSKIENSFDKWNEVGKDWVKELIKLENENNSLFCEKYNIEEENEALDFKSKISLTANPHYRYGYKVSELEYDTRFQNDSVLELISYATGCMMGRYSLSREGLVYAYSGNEGFKQLVAEGAYNTFPADDDGIVPLASENWLFEDDATARFREFVKTVWGDEHLQENLEFVAESLCLHALKPVKGESANDTVRRYFSNQFYKDHCKTYKKRPIYWLFSSGKEKAFECLVYLHRYNEGTLARMRTEYVTPLMGKYDQQQSMLSEQIIEASNTEKRSIEKDLKSLEKKQAELRTFDEQLKHYAEMRITLDLDDGVKANYGKFGNLLADVKAIHGKAVK